MARERGGFWIGLCAVVLYPTVLLLGRRVCKGNRLPEQGGALLVMNHVSHLDPCYDAVLVHRFGRVPRFLAKHSLWRVPVLGAVLTRTGQIPVHRGSTDAKQSLSAAEKALADGKLLVIYPEGTVTKDPEGWPMRARTGVARLALACDVPVIPAARWGTREIFDGYRKRLRPFPRKTVTTLIGEPIDLSSYRARLAGEQLSGTNQVFREVSDLLMDKVKELLTQIRLEEL